MVYNEKPYEQMDDLGGFPPIFGSTPIWIHSTPAISSFQLFLPASHLQNHTFQ